MKIKVYISGAISALPHNDAKEMFRSTEDYLYGQGFDVVDPFDNGLDKNEPWENHMRVDLAMLLDCDCVYMLKGWRSSKGARLEHLVASSLGMEILYQPKK